MCLIGHLGLPLSGEFPGQSLAASIVFAASAFVVFNEWNRLVGSLIVTRQYCLAKRTPLAHNATMTESPVFMTDVVKDIGNPNRFRWNIYENRKRRDKSF